MVDTETTIPELLGDLKAAIAAAEAELIPLADDEGEKQYEYRVASRLAQPVRRRLRDLQAALIDRVQGPPLHFQTIVGALRRGGHKQHAYPHAGFRASKSYSHLDTDTNRVIDVHVVSGTKNLTEDERTGLLDAYEKTLTLEGYDVTRRNRVLLVRRRKQVEE